MFLWIFLQIFMRLKSNLLQNLFCTSRYLYDQCSFIIVPCYDGELYDFIFRAIQFEQTRNYLLLFMTDLLYSCLYFCTLCPDLIVHVLFTWTHRWGNGSYAIIYNKYVILLLNCLWNEIFSFSSSHICLEWHCRKCNIAH